LADVRMRAVAAAKQPRSLAILSCGVRWASLLGRLLVSGSRKAMHLANSGEIRLFFLEERSQRSQRN